MATPLGGTVRTLGFLGAAALALLAVAPAEARAQQKPAMTQSLASAANFTSGAGYNRAALRYVVIHKTEGSTTSGCVSWFQNPSARASAHYLVGRAGDCVEMVLPRDVAWHAGNWTVNKQSIGIEHVGFTAQGDVTAAQLDKSARLTAWICKTYGVPVDRQSIIGHDEVPDPSHAGQYGGAGHHSDPGGRWDWVGFMALVRQYSQASTGGGSGTGTGTSGGTTTTPHGLATPYAESFDAGSTGFVSNATSVWRLDAPASYAAQNQGLPPGAFSGGKCAGTVFATSLPAGLSGVYLATPSIDIGGLARPVLDAKVAYDLARGLDGAQVFGSADDGRTWVALEPAQGYPVASIGALNGDEGYGGQSLGWEDCYVDLAPIRGARLARICFAVFTDAASGGSAGLFVDEVRVDDASRLPPAEPRPGAGSAEGGASASGSRRASSGGGSGGCALGAAPLGVADGVGGVFPWAALLGMLAAARKAGARRRGSADRIY